jgi:signal transduction histidine kinase/DNA-binding NarL/FixJ family response regulator
MTYTPYKSLTFAIIVVSILMLGPNVDFVGAKETEKKAQISLTQEEREWLRTNPHIKLATLTNQPPFSMMDADGNHTGILADILAHLSGAIGQKTETELVKEAISGTHEVAKQDGIYGSASILKTSRHANEYLLTDPFMTTPFYIYTTTKNRNEIRRPADLRGKRVAVPRNHRAVEEFLAGIGGVQTVPADTPLEQMQKVISGEAEALIGYFTYPYLVNKYLMVDLVIVFIAKSDQGIHIGVNPEHPILHGILNKAIAMLDDDTINAITAKWIEVSQEEASKLELTPEEQAWLNEHPVVRTSFNHHPPYMYAEDGQRDGLTADLLNKISEIVDITFEIEKIPGRWSDLLERLIRHEDMDMLPAIMPTPEREKVILFTEPYIDSPRFIFTRDDAPFIASIRELPGRSIAVVNNFAVHRELEKKHPDIELLLFDHLEQAIKSVSSGEAFAFIGDLISTPALINKLGLKNLKAACPGGLSDHPLAMGVRNDWPELRDILNKAIKAIPSDELAAIRNRWSTVKVEYGISSSDVMKWSSIIFISVSIIVFLFFFWNRQLSREINRRKKTELALKQAKNEAEASNQAKSSFLANMSHELRTPLNAILGFSRLLAQEEDTTPDQQEKLTIINRSGQHLLAMINEVLDLSKIEAGNVEMDEHPFDLVALLNEISVMIQSRAVEKGLLVVVETEAGRFPYVKADEGKIRQTLINLLSNAVKFTDEGGVTIRCATESKSEEPKRCHIVIEVEDTGPGIAPARQANIFEPFVQGTDELDRKGTGLGLSICKKYVDIMDGTIELESEVGKGSLFRVRLPAEIAESADFKTPVDDKPRVIGLAPGQKTWRILIVDDNRENLLLLKSLLEEVGFIVLEAENGKQAVEAFEKESPELILMDMRMPVMDGYEATRRIRNMVGGDLVKIVATTASAFKEQRPDILAAGCNEVVYKPFRDHEIFETMARVLDIKYFYEEKSIEAIRKAENNLTADMLADLPGELLQELRETTLALNREAAFEVIARIADRSPEAGAGLKELVDNYQMVELRDLLGDIR